MVKSTLLVSGDHRYLALDHGWPLSPESPDGLEDIHHSLVPDPLQHDAQGDEDAGPPDASTGGHMEENVQLRSNTSRKSSEEVLNE